MTRRSQSTNHRFFWFSFHATARELREPPKPPERPLGYAFQLDLHKTRDGAAFVELAAVLQRLGYTYGGILFNVPATFGSMDRTSAPSFTPDDLLVLVTRPPLNKQEGAAKPCNARGERRVDRSESELETTVFESLGMFFEHCGRDEVLLNAEYSALGQSAKEFEREFCFRKTAGAFRRKRGSTTAGDDATEKKQEEEVTTGFLAFRPSAWPNGPRILASFGMGGVETLIFNHLLRLRKADLIGSIFRKDVPALIIADFTIPPINCRPYDLRFVSSVRFESSSFILSEGGVGQF